MSRTPPDGSRPDGPASQAAPSPRRGTALGVLAISLAVTMFVTWLEQELLQRDEVIEFSDGFSQVAPVFMLLTTVRFSQASEIARSTLGRSQYTDAGWQAFLQDTGWPARVPGLKEAGYAELQGDRCVVKFVAGQTEPVFHPAGTDLAADPALRETVEKCADGGLGMAAPDMILGTGTNATHVSVGLIPLMTGKRGDTAAWNRAHIHSFLFFALNHAEYFPSWSPELAKMPFNYQLLAPGEQAPVALPTRRVISQTTVTGQWRFVVTLKAPRLVEHLPQWIVLGAGLALSGLLYWLFDRQASLQLAGSLASREILERETVERQLQTALRREQELNRLKSNFVSMVTHEIRTPLAHIQGAADILSRYLDRLPPEKRAQHFAHINAAVHRMSALMEDVLLFSKAEAGRIEFKPAPLDVPCFCRQIAEELRSATSRRCPIEVVLNDVDAPARGDENLLRHIFTNLISNAVKYSPAGSPVTFSATRREGFAEFQVRDRGLGIPEEDRQQLFTPFHRGKNVASLHGTGLGLVIVKHCVEQHGGDLEIDTRENEGTTVHVRLPLFSSAETAANAPSNL